jgi:glycosyltransferase involved in cell wall biosynthesis
MKISFIIPVYNDEVSLKKLIENIKIELKNFTLHFIIIDDCSEDNFESLKSISQIDIVTLLNNQGSQKAISIGLNYTLGEKIDFDYLIVMDSDGEDKPVDLNLLIEQAIKDNNFIIFASRKKRLEIFMFKFFYFTYRFLFRFLTGKKINFGNFSCIPKKLLKDTAKTSYINFHYPAAIIKSKHKYKTIPGDKGSRYAGQSKMSFFNLFFHALKSLSIFYKEIFIRFVTFFFISNCVILLSLKMELAIVINILVVIPVSIFFLYLRNLINRENLIDNTNYRSHIKNIKSI